uniref:FHA domain-containing protein n=1 Tax=Acrobeloides nanus TaxID=290746 RepID=A0A914C9G5_9BILA
MLRQYSTKGIQNFDLSTSKKDFSSSTTIIGSGENCDIVIKGKNVAERHALIEYHPLTRSYWLRDLGTLGGTTCNGKSLYGMVEMNSADVLQFADSAPYVFELPTVQPSPKKEKWSKIVPRANEERFMKQFSMSSNKKLCQQRRESELYKNILPEVQDSSSSGQMIKEELSINIRPISSKARIRRSISLHRPSLRDDFKIDRLPRRLFRNDRASFSSMANKQDTPSSGNSSAGEIKEFKYPRLSLTKEENSIESPRTPIGSQLLRRIVRLQDSSSSGQMIKEELSINIRPISSKARIRRSISLHRPSLRDDFKIDRLPRRLFRNDRASFSSMANKQDTPSSGNSSAGEIKEFKYPRLSLTKEENSIESPRTPIGSQLLRRIVRLQDELHRRDLEIEKLKENALLPSNSGERVKHHLDEYRNALAKAQLDNEKLRAILELNAPNMPGEWITQHNERVKNSETELLVKDLIIQTFFSVCYEQLDELAQNLSNTPMRDYADTFLEIIKSLQDPFSFRLMEINTKCGQIFDKQKFSDSQRQKLYEQFDLFLKGNIHPVSKSLDIFFPVLKDAVTIARESVRACAVFSQWSREMGDQVMSDGLNWELLVYKVDDLHIRFRETNLAKHWLLPSLIPLFKTLALEHKKHNVETKERELKQKYDLQQTEEKVSNLIILVEEQKAELAKGQYEIENYQQQNQELKAELQKITQEFEKVSKYEKEVKRPLQKITQEFEKVSKYEKEVRKLEEENKTLRKEKQELEDELTSEVEQLQERLRIASEPIITKLLARHDSSSSTSGLPRLTKAQSVPKIQLEDRSATPSEVSRGETPDQIHDLIDEHFAHAQPLSPISSVDTEENAESPNLDIEEQVEGDGEAKKREQRSVSEEPENEELHMDAINEPEEIILSTTPEEPSEIPETPEEVHQTSHDDQKQPENPEVSDKILNQQEREQVQEKSDEDKQVEEISNEISEEPIDSLETVENIEKMEQIPENQEEAHAEKLDEHIELTETPADQLQETPETVLDDQVTTGPKDVPEDPIETPIARETHVTVQEPSTETVEPHLVMIDCGDNLVVVEEESDAIASAPEDRPAEIVNLDEEAIEESDQLQDSPESPSAHEHESPSTQDHESLLAQEHESPSALEQESLPAQEHESPSVHDHESLSAQEHESPSAHEHKSPSTQDHESLLAQEHESPSALEHESLPAQEHESPSVHDQESLSAQEHESPSVHEHESPSAHEHESSLAHDHDQVGESDTDHSEDEESIKDHGDVEEDEAQVKRTSRQVSEDQQVETQSQEAMSEPVETIEDIETPNEPLHEISRAQEIEELSEPQETEKVDKLEETPANVQEPPKVEEAHEPQVSEVVEEPPEDTKILNHVEETESPRESNEDVDEIISNENIITNEDKSPSPVETSRIDELEEQLSKTEEDYQHHQVGDSATDHSEDEDSDEDFRRAEGGVSSQRVSRQASMDQKPEHHEALDGYKVEPHNESQNGETETPEASEAHLGPQEVPSEASEAHLGPQEVSSEAAETHLEPQEVRPEAAEAHLEPQEVPPEAAEAHLEPQEVPSEASEAHLGPQEVSSEAAETHLEPQEVPSEATETHLEPQEVPSVPSEAAETHLEPQEVRPEAAEAHLEPQEVPPKAAEAHLEPQEVPPEAAEAHLEPQEVPLEASEAHLEPQEVPPEAAEAHLEPQEVPVEQTLPTPPESIQPLEDLHINGVHMQIRPRKSVSSTDGEKPPLPRRNSKKSEIASKLPRLDTNLPQPKKSTRRTRSRQNSKDQTSPGRKISSPIDAIRGNHIEVINAPRGEIGRRDRARSARNRTREGPLPAPRPRRASEDVLASPTVVKEVNVLDTQQLEQNNIHETEKELHPSQAEVDSQENLENQEKSEPQATPPVQEDQHMPNHFNIDPRLSIDTVIKPIYDDEISDHEHSMPGSPNVTSEESIHPAETDDETIMSTDRGEGNLNVVNGLGVPLRETMHSRIENREEDEGRPDSDEVEKVVNTTENEKFDTTATEQPKFNPVQKWHEIDEFWQLVFTLAKMLSLDLPTTLNDPDQDETHRRRNAIDLLLLELENKLNKKRQQSASSKKSSKKNSKTSKASENGIPEETRIASVGDEDVFFDENDPEVHKAAETIQKQWRKSRLVQR